MRLEDLIVPTCLNDAKTTDRVFLPCDDTVAHSILFDIKTVGLAQIGFKNTGLQKDGSFWTRERAAFEIDKINCYNVNYGMCASYYDDITIGLRPCINLDLNLYLDLQDAMKKRNDDERYAFYRDPADKEHDYMLLDFGEYPQTILNGDAEFEQKKDQYVETGRKFLTAFDSMIGQPTFCPEYSYGQKKCVKVQSNAKIYYLAVEPLQWIVTNWHEMPRELNANGNGQATTIKLITRNVINYGIPFYRVGKFDIAKLRAKRNVTLWQNSTVRGYLNGYNVNNIKENGDPQLSAPAGGDFTKYNFIDEAFTPEREKLQTISCGNLNRKGWGVNFGEQPLNETEQLRKYIEQGHPVMLHGPSGIGKSRRVQEIDPDFVSITLRNGMLPEEIIGKNIFVDEKNVNAGQWQAPAWYTELCEKCAKEPKKRHVLFIDELTNVREQEQSAVFHIVLDHSITPNCGKLPDNVSIVAAGNSMDESTAAYEMAQPLERRFYGHIYLQPNIPDWLDWASRVNKKKGHLNVHPLVAAFVASMGDTVFCPQYDQDNPPKYKIDPRGWEQVSDLIYANGNVIYEELIANKIGPALTRALIAFTKTPALTVENVVNGEYIQQDIPQSFDAQYALAMMWRYARPEQIPAIRAFVTEHLNKEILAVYDAACGVTANKLVPPLEFTK